jgi:hypothetical protein
MSAVRALMFVHQGMDVENQWEKAVAALESMSNLEIALVWRRLSESVPVDDFKMHSEYKCLFKRAVREAEERVGVGCYHQNLNNSCEIDDNGSVYCGGSVHYEGPPISRHNSNFSVGSVGGYGKLSIVEHSNPALNTSKIQLFRDVQGSFDEIHTNLEPGARRTLVEPPAPALSPPPAVF